MNPGISVVRLLVAVVALSASQGCSMFESRTLVYVDNGGTAEVEVRVDEAAPVTIAAGSYSAFKLKDGSHRFVVRRQGQVVYDQSRSFPKSEKVAKYVLNPDMSRRYTSEAVGYTTYTSGPRFGEDPGQALRATALLKPDPWVAGSFDEVLDETPPDSVRVKRGEIGAHRNRLCRITPEDHDRLAAAKAAYMDALRGAPNQLPRLEGDAEAALQRVLRACSKAP